LIRSCFLNFLKEGCAMSMGDKGADKRATTFQRREKASGTFDPSEASTQIRRGKGLATIRVLEGPGAGTSHVVYPGDNAIGRDPQNRIALDFGDQSIHREGHAWITAQEGKFSIRHGGKNNPVYVAGETLTGSRSIKLGDQIKLGATILRLDPA
jgi:hypothetical protein